MTEGYVSPAPKEPPPAPEPPQRRVAPRAWVRENLFSSVFNGVLTVVFGLLLAWVLYRIGRFVLVDARWEIIERNTTNLLVFRFPRDEFWRLWTASFVLALGFGFAAGSTARAGGGGIADRTLALRRAAPLLVLVAVFLVLAGSLTATLLIAGIAAVGLAARYAGSRLPVRRSRALLVALASLLAAYLVVAHFGGVGWSRWGGLLLTVFLAVGGIVLSFPLGVLLALGRRSRLPVVRWVCIAYIELIRGVPLITILFMGAFMLGFFLPAGMDTPSLETRALVALTIFTSAYVAEIVRGGLQSVPRGQVEAAQALGFSAYKTTRLIVLPQALRISIPPIVNSFISLFKDTSLVVIIALYDFAYAVKKSIETDFSWRPYFVEAFLFSMLIYWIFCWSMSKYSQRLERELAAGRR